MKKIFIFSVMLLGALAFNSSANAACGSTVTVGDERLCMAAACGFVECEYESQSNASGTAYTKRLEDGSIILVLDNYKGGSIYFSSGLSNPIGGTKIELIGDNYITNENEYGILSFVTGISFIGDGNLTIKSKVPFVSMDADRQSAVHSFSNNEVTTIKIIAGETKTEELNPTDSNKEENNNETVQEVAKGNNNLVVIALVVSLCVSILCLIVMIGLVVKNNKSKKVNE